MLLASLGSIDGELLSKAIHSTFVLRATHPLSQKMPSLSKTVRLEYSRLAGGLGLRFDDFDDAEVALAEFINPILQSDELRLWNANKWRWESSR